MWCTRWCRRLLLRALPIPTTGAIRTPGNAFQIQVELPQNQMQSVEQVGGIPVMPAGSPKPLLDDIASLKPGTMPGEIDRYNGQRVVSLTANIHGITLGEAAGQAQPGAGRGGRAAARRLRADARRDSAARANHLRVAHRLAAGRGGDLSAAFRELPIRAAGAGDRADGSGGAVRRAADAAGHRHHAQRPIVHGRDHGHRHRGGQFDPAGHVRRARRGMPGGRCWMPRAKAPAAGCAPC